MKLKELFAQKMTSDRRVLRYAAAGVFLLSLLLTMELPYVWSVSFKGWISLFFAVGTVMPGYNLPAALMILVLLLQGVAAVCCALGCVKDRLAARVGLAAAVAAMAAHLAMWYSVVSDGASLGRWVGQESVSLSLGAYAGMLLSLAAIVLLFALRFERMVKRDTISQGKAWGVRGAAFVAALATGALLLMALGNDPIAVYKSMLNGALGKKLFIQETVKLTVPLLITAIGIAFAFKMRFWNIGGEGQILAGGVAASAIAIYFGESWPSAVLLIVMFVAAVAAGGLYGVIPALFKSKWDTNETLFTLMLNYIALQFVKFLCYQPAWQQPNTTFPKIRSFAAAARLPQVFGIHIGWIVAIVVVIAAYLYINHTKQGYEIAVVGESNNTARYAGMNVSKVFIRTMFISGALCGLAGYLIVSGANGTLGETTAGGAGFTAITVAWLAKMNPLAMVVVAAFIAMLQRGALRIETTHGIPAAASEVLVGIILFFMLGCEFFINYKLVFRAGREDA